MAKRLQNVSADSILFTPGIRRSPRKKSTPVVAQTMNDLQASAASLTGSFRYDAPGSPLKSTQQLNLDFSDFSTHTFFNSAEAKVQKAFDRIINQFPFDGKKNDVDLFVDKLTGFEKHVFDLFPSRSGYLAFSGSSSPTDPGTFLSVKDFVGAFQPSLAKKPTGTSAIDPGTKPFTFELNLSLPQIANDNEIILQKISSTPSNGGLTLALSQSASTSTCNVVALVASASSFVSASMQVDKGKFTHIGMVFDRTSGPGAQIKLYHNAALKASSSFSAIGQIDFTPAPLTIGSGSALPHGNNTFTPQQTLSGAMCDVRMWHTARTQHELRVNKNREIFAQNGLQLLFRFNEPSGSFVGGSNGLVLDSSGNALHTTTQNFSMSQRSTSSFGPSPVTENSKKSTISLFPSFQPLRTLHTDIITNAAAYDAANPNIVTRLVPPHYLRDSAQLEGFQTESGAISDQIRTQIDSPGGAVIGQPQIIAGILFTFAETFDELKMFVDEFKRLLKVDVLSNDTVSDQLLPWLSRYYGIELPRLFDAASAKQFLDGQNIRKNKKSTVALQAVQNALWRRIFADLPFLLQTRGTHASLRAILANVGIAPNGAIRIREFGGSSVKNLGDSFTQRTEVAAMVDMSGTLATAGTLNTQGIDSLRPFLQSPFLSGSRIEPGKPLAVGPVHPTTGSQHASDGLFTSGSWTFEAIYKFDRKIAHPAKQSLARLHSTGTSAPSLTQGMVVNCVASKPSAVGVTTGSLTLFARPDPGTADNTLQLALTGVNVFDGAKWQVSFGRRRRDEINSYQKSEYFLRAAKFTPAGLEQFATTGTFFADANRGTKDTQLNIFENITPKYNSKGIFVVIGSQSIDTASGRLLNNTNTPDANITTFTGKLASMRFYSKALTELETKTHARNFKSLGVIDPEVNFNFVTHATGSFERLRIDASFDQPITKSAADGTLRGFDFSQNSLHMEGTGFEVSKEVIKPERFNFQVLSSKFESGENPNKIRIRSFKSSDNVRAFDTAFAPLYDIPQNDQPNDDKRIAIEVSVTQGLDEDIMTIFGTLNALDNIIGSPELVFAQEYPRLRNLRRIYFNRLTEKVNFLSFFEFFKFFDDTIGDLLEQMLPSDSRFAGSSYVIEPHALERAKFTYKYSDMYLGEEDRGAKSPILLQQFVGVLRKR